MNAATAEDLIANGIEKYLQKQISVRKEKIYLNTRLLMENYTKLKNHADNAVYKASQLFETDNVVVLEANTSLFITGEAVELYNKNNVYIDTILKSKVRTTIMLQHIDMALEMLKESMSQEMKKYDAFTDLYIRQIPYNELEEKYNCAERTLRRWKNEILEKLSILLFGENALIL